MDRGRLCCGGADQRTHPPGETQKCHQSCFQTSLLFTLSPSCHHATFSGVWSALEHKRAAPAGLLLARRQHPRLGSQVVQQITKLWNKKVLTINRDPQKPAQSFQTIVGASHIRWSRGDCTYLARCSMLDKVQRCIWQQRENTAERFLSQCSWWRCEAVGLQERLSSAHLPLSSSLQGTLALTLVSQNLSKHPRSTRSTGATPILTVWWLQATTARWSSTTSKVKEKIGN